MASLYITLLFSYSNICLVRRNAMDSFDPTTVSPPPTFETEIDGQFPTTELLQIDTQLGETRLADQREMPSRGRSQARHEARQQMFFESRTRYASPEALFVCDGWCSYSEEPHPNVVSIEHLLLWDSGFTFVASSRYPPAPTRNSHGKAPKAR